jgi:hypothetical protein
MGGREKQKAWAQAVGARDAVVAGSCHVVMAVILIFVCASFTRGVLKRNI